MSDRKVAKISSKEAAKQMYNKSGGQRPAEVGNKKAAAGIAKNGQKQRKGKSIK